MKSHLTSCITTLLLLCATSTQCFAMISVGSLNKKEAKELGITMHSQKNGDAGVKVWLEFKKEGFLKACNYVELRMEDEKENHMISAILEAHPVHHGQLDDLVTVAFSADPKQLNFCSFMIVAYGSTRGDVGYVLKVSDFIDVEKEYPLEK